MQVRMIHCLRRRIDSDCGPRLSFVNTAAAGTSSSNSSIGVKVRTWCLTFCGSSHRKNDWRN